MGRCHDVPLLTQVLEVLLDLGADGLLVLAVDREQHLARYAEMQGRCRGDAGEMQGRSRGDLGGI